LSGFGHLTKYTSVPAGAGYSNYREVLNRFAGFNFFAEQDLKKGP